MNLDPKQVRDADKEASNSIEPTEPLASETKSQLPDDSFLLHDLKDKVKTPEAERGIPQDLSVRSDSKMRTVAMLVIGLFAVGLLSAAVMRWGAGWFSKEPKAEKQTVETTGNSSNSGRYNFDKSQQAALAAAASEVEIVKAASEPEPKTEVASSEVKEASPPTETPPPPPPDLRLTSPLSFDSSDSSGGGVLGLDDSEKGTAKASGSSQLLGGGGSDADEAPSGSKPQGLGARLTASVFPSEKAKQRGNIDFLLGRGTGIQCGLMTRIVTTHPGVTKCQVLEDVYSANGKVLLVEKGSVIHGEQQSALTQGQALVFAAWTTLETPNGVSVNIDSLGADPLGGSGHAARVNNHFWKRIGGAVMISMMSDSINIYGRRSSNSSNVSFESTTESAQDVATEVLKNTINIPPTGYVNQGERIMVYLVRDVDFSDVYELVDTN